MQACLRAYGVICHILSALGTPGVKESDYLTPLGMLLTLGDWESLAV